MVAEAKVPAAEASGDTLSKKQQKKLAKDALKAAKKEEKKSNSSTFEDKTPKVEQTTYKALKMEIYP